MKVYLSSTKADLEEYREAVSEILRAPLGFEVIDSYDAATGTVRETCLDDVSTCQAYVGIFAWRYGHVPQDANPERRSITELEYLRAKEKGIPRFLFLLGDSEAWPGDAEHDDTKNDAAVAGAKVRELRKTVLADRGAMFKAQPGDLAGKVLRALERWKTESGSPMYSPGAALRTVPVPALRQPWHTIVGRDSLVRKVLDGFAHGQKAFAFVYLIGVGKTALATQLIKSSAIQQRFPDGVLWAHLGAIPDVGRQLRKWARALSDTEEAKSAVDRMADADLASTVAESIGERRMLLVIDDVWSKQDGAQFMLGGGNCAYVITTRNRTVALELMPSADNVINVPKLSEDDGFAVLKQFAPVTADRLPGALRQLVHWVDGLPIALVLIGNMLKGAGDNKPAIEAVRRNLRELYSHEVPADGLERGDATYIKLEHVIEASYRALDGDALRQAAADIAVLRPDPAWFTVELATQGIDLPESALERLSNAGLVERVHYPGEDEWETGNARFTMHRVLAEYLRGKLPAERTLALHRKAADYYLNRLKSLEEQFQNEEATSYRFMYRYEDAEWQDSQDNWLYYFAQTGYDREASLSFMQAWFDGFWWWSCFTDAGFDFCDQLLQEWEQRLTSSATTPISAGFTERLGRRVEALGLLRRFKQAYPKETDENRAAGAWGEVAASLTKLRQLSGLDGDRTSLSSAEERHVRGLTDIFLAEAARFGRDRNTAVAEAYYREALALFREGAEKWNIAWTLYHLADMLAGDGRLDAAATLCEEALSAGRAEGDHEVVSLLHRILGDAALASGDMVAAADNYHQAVLQAYMFQVRPAEPDAYTIRFYAQVATSVARRLLEAPARGLANKVALAIRGSWTGRGVKLPEPEDRGDLLATPEVATLTARLFPAAISPDAGAEALNAYAREVEGHLERVGA